MASRLTFIAGAGDKVFGVMVVRAGIATARVRGMVLKDALLGHAMQWLTCRNPDPAAPVRFKLVGRF